MILVLGIWTFLSRPSRTPRYGVNCWSCSGRSPALGFAGGTVSFGSASHALADLASQPCPGPARHRRRLASPRLPPLRALDVPVAFTRSFANRPRAAHTHSTRGPRQSHLGPAPDSSRTPLPRL